MKVDRPEHAKGRKKEEVGTCALDWYVSMNILAEY
jgi:hypothetical protein